MKQVRECNRLIAIILGGLSAGPPPTVPSQYKLRPATASVTNLHYAPDTELVEHNGHQIRLSPNGLEWLAFVALSRQRPALIMAADRDADLAKAYEWIEAQRSSENTAP